MICVDIEVLFEAIEEMKERMERQELEVEVRSDGHTVWVNGPDGGCIGRFSRFGIDVHRTAVEQATMGQCLDCDHTPSWERFQESMLKHYGVQISNEHRPRWVTA